MGKESMGQMPENPAKDKMNKMMPKNDMDVSGLVSAEDQNLQKKSKWTEVENKRYTFVGETEAESLSQQKEFIKLVKSGVKPNAAYTRITGAPSEEVKELKPAEVKKAYTYIKNYNGKQLARLLGFKNCQDAIDYNSPTVIREKYEKMGFEEYQADNAYKVLYDGTRAPFYEIKPNGKEVKISQVIFHKKFGPKGVSLHTAESYARTQMSETELAQLKKQEEAKTKKAEELASAQAVDDLF